MVDAIEAFGRAVVAALALVTHRVAPQRHPVAPHDAIAIKQAQQSDALNDHDEIDGDFCAQEPEARPVLRECRHRRGGGGRAAEQGATRHARMIEFHPHRPIALP